MKFIIVLACLLAVAFADKEAVTKSEFVEVNPDGFKYGWETSNGIKVEQHGDVKDEHTNQVSGSFEYISPEGKPVHVTYTADENGYKPVVHV